MTDHYTDADRQRLTPKGKLVLHAMLDAGWLTLDEVSAKTGVKVGTVASRLRDFKAAAWMGLDYERKRIGEGLHAYRLFTRHPEQMPLFEGQHDSV